MKIFTRHVAGSSYTALQGYILRFSDSFHKMKHISEMSYIMKHILRLVNYYNKTITSHTTNIFTLTFRSLPETFIRRSLFSSSYGSYFCHDRDVKWQEISRTCGLACSCPRLGSRIVVPLSEHVLFLWSTKYFCLIPYPRWAIRTTDFLPRHISVLARTGRRSEEASSNEGLWLRPKRQGKKCLVVSKQ